MVLHGFLGRFSITERRGQVGLLVRVEISL